MGVEGPFTLGLYLTSTSLTFIGYLNIVYFNRSMSIHTCRPMFGIYTAAMYRIC